MTEWPATAVVSKYHFCRCGHALSLQSPRWSVNAPCYPLGQTPPVATRSGAPDAGQHDATPRLACTPAAIRTVLAANANPDTLRRYDADLDAAFERARRNGDLTPLLDTVRRWWFEADNWRDPAARRQFQARVSRYQSDGPPPAAERVNRARLREQYGV